MKWIDHGYDLVWDKSPPIARETRNFKSSLDNHVFVTTTITKMMEAGAVSVLPPGVTPTVVSSLGVVPKPHSDKFRLIVNMRYVTILPKSVQIRGPIRFI
jgi:hypothetical protein